MPRWAKVTVWVVAFAAFAGAGAYVAAHTDPFPPGVEDPGARPEPSASSTSSPAVTPRWRVAVTSRTAHELHVGGTCTSSWTIRAVVEPDAAGTFATPATAELEGTAQCPFATAQVQTTSVPVILTGTVRRGTMGLTIAQEAAPSPKGSAELGGFVKTLPVKLFVKLSGTGGDVTAVKTVSDSDLGRYVAKTHVSVTCAAACPD